MLRHMLLALAMVLWLASVSPAQHESPEAAHESSAAVAPGHHEAGEAEAKAHPTPPSDPAWAGKLVAAIGIMFLAAIPIGMFVRANMPQEAAPANGHDEAAGAGHDAHGHGGH